MTRILHRYLLYCSLIYLLFVIEKIMIVKYYFKLKHLVIKKNVFFENDIIMITFVLKQKNIFMHF